MRRFNRIEMAFVRLWAIGVLCVALLCGCQAKPAGVSGGMASDSSAAGKRIAPAESADLPELGSSESAVSGVSPLPSSVPSAAGAVSSKKPAAASTALPDGAVVTAGACPVYKTASAKAEQVTQAIYNQPLTVLARSGGFLRVKVVDGYEGYVQEKNVTVALDSLRDTGLRLMVRVPVAEAARSGGGHVKIPLCTELWSTGLQGNSYTVLLPEGQTGTISAAAVTDITAGRKKDTAEQLIQTARQFLSPKTPYLWGGVTALDGMDCSGFTYMCYRLCGVDLPRDSSPQSAVGAMVNLADITAGDQVFFSTNPGGTKVTHTGICIGDGQFIHSSTGNKGVAVNRMDEAYYRDRLVVIRRRELAD